MFCTAISVQAQYSINSEFGNLTDCDTISRGIYIVWWDNDWDYKTDAEVLLDSMIKIRNKCLNELDMQDPPNPIDGHFYNVYLHHAADIFPSQWANGQGTDINGYPFLTLPIGAHNDWVNVRHETFHIFQYNANSPGFAYSGDSQWYIEASANWFAIISDKDNPRNFLEAESLVRLPNLPLWLSYDNFPPSYPSNWQRYVHQYGMALFLFYLTEEAGVPENLICDGFFTGTSELPQEYLFNQLGGQVFRDNFIDWAGHMTNHFDFLSPAQITVLENEWDSYADPADDNEFIQTYSDTGTSGWYQTDDTLITTAWSFNTYKVENSSTDTYTFQLQGESVGSEGDPAYFQGQVVVVNNTSGASFYDLDMTNDWEGTRSIEVTPDDTVMYFIIASMPEVFQGVSQTFPYDIKIEKGTINGIPKLQEQHFDIARETARYNLLGQTIDKDHIGIQVILYSDGTAKKIMKMDK